MARQSESFSGTNALFPWVTAMPHSALTRVWMETAGAWQQEVARFASDRLRKDSEAARGFQGCRNWGEMAKLHQEWLASTAQDYAELMGRLGQTAAKFGTEMAQSTGDAAGQSAEAMRSAAGRRFTAE